MRKFLVYSLSIIFVMVSLSFGVVIAKDKNAKAPKVQSTEGVEVTKTDQKNISKGKSDKKQAKQNAKKRRKIVRNMSKIEKYEDKKRIKGRDEAFLQNRLNKKVRLLNSLKADDQAKQNSQAEDNQQVHTSSQEVKTEQLENNNETEQNNSDDNSVKNEKGEN